MKKSIQIIVSGIAITIISVLQLKSQEDWQSLNEKVQSYYQQAKYEIAVEYGIKALTQAEKEYGKDSKFYASSANFLGVLYQQLEQYQKAEPLYKESSKLFLKFFGDGHPFYGQSMMNLGLLYYQMHRYEEAERKIKIASFVYAQNYGKESKEYATPIKNLAKLYFDMKNYKDSEKNFIEALVIYRKVLGPGDMDYITPLFELATLYKVIKQYKQAEPLYLEIKEIYKQLYGDSSAEYAHSLYNLAIIKDLLGQYQEAQTLLDDALKIYGDLFGETHQYFIKTRQCLARVYNNKGDFERSKEIWMINLDVYLNQIKNYFPTLSEIEKGKFYSNVSPNFEEFNSFVLKWQKRDPSLLGKMYDNQLATKAILLNATTKVRRLILNSGDKQLIEKFDNWVSLKEKLSKFYTLSKERLEKGKIDISLFEKKANLIERELSKESELFAKEFPKSTVSWKDIKNNLKPDEAAIEIVRFRHYDKSWTDSVYYAALIVTANTTDHPGIVILENGNKLEKEYLSCYKNMIKFTLPDADSYGAYWEKIQSSIPENVKTAYVSLDGVYNQLNILTFRFSETKFLLDSLDIHFVHNTKFLVEKPVQSKEPAVNAAELFGNPDFEFDKTKEQIAKLAKNVGTQDMISLNLAENKPWDNFSIAKASQDIKKIKINELPGTKQEITEIDNLLKEFNWNLNTYMQTEATESNVKALKNPGLLHIATHGFFLDDIETNPDSKVFGVNAEEAVENPLLRSGLLLAGATKEIAGENDNTKIDDNDNGILTAYEAMNLDLDKTQLVVLSACETGVGENKNGEGVYGLQRAFEVAGAKTVIMSLWTVNDYATRELMTNFYKSWISSGNKREAFKEAQLFMKNKYKWPYFWGAFVMVGD